MERRFHSLGRALGSAGLACLLLSPVRAASQGPGPQAPPDPTGTSAADAAAQGEPVSITREPEEVRKRLLTLLEGALLDTENGQDFVETSGYRRLLEKIQEYSPEEFAAKVTRSLDYASAIQDPDAWRGEFVRVRGVIVNLSAEKLATPMLGHADVFRGIVAQTEGSDGVVFDVLEPPPIQQFDTRRDLVDVEGVFFRTVTYENRAGKQVRAPYLIARTLARLDPESLHRTERHPIFGLLIVVTGLVVAVCLGYVLMRGPRKRGGRSEDDPDPSKFIRERAGRRAPRP